MLTEFITYHINVSSENVTCILLNVVMLLLQKLTEAYVESLRDDFMKEDCVLLKWYVLRISDLLMVVIHHCLPASCTYNRHLLYASNKTS